MDSFISRFPRPVFAADGGGGGAVTPTQVNDMARRALLGNGIESLAQIAAGNVTVGAGTNVVNIVPRNVGFIRGFLVKINATYTNTDGANPSTLSPFGPANILSQIVFNDLQNNVRINTTGWHLTAVNTAKRQWVYGAAYTSDTPLGYGSNWSVITAPASVAKGASAALQMFYYVPLTYSQDDLRGGIFANVVNATMLLSLTFNVNNTVAAAADTTNAVYGGAAGNLNNVSYTVYQDFIDQVPVGKNGPVIPLLDISQIYEMKSTPLTALVANQDFAIPYSNFRSFLSTTVVFDNQVNGVIPGAGTTPKTYGSDVNYWALQSANFTNIWKVDPYTSKLRERNIVGDDFPPSMYYFDHRRKPISTIQYGNLELLLNAATVNAGSNLVVGFEDIAIINQISGAGSLPNS